jgi:hypothetical protein
VLPGGGGDPVVDAILVVPFQDLDRGRRQIDGGSTFHHDQLPLDIEDGGVERAVVGLGGEVEREQIRQAGAAQRPEHQRREQPRQQPLA